MPFSPSIELTIRFAVELGILLDWPMMVMMLISDGFVAACRRLRRLEEQRVVCEPSSSNARVVTV